MRQEHGEPGHLNVYVRDRESDRTGKGQHCRTVIMRDVGGRYTARCDHTAHDPELPLPTYAQLKLLMMREGWTFRRNDVPHVAYHSTPARGRLPAHTWLSPVPIPSPHPQESTR